MSSSAFFSTVQNAKAASQKKVTLNAPVFLACEQVERVLCSQEVVIIQNLYGRHPVGVAVFGDLITPEIANVFNQNSTVHFVVMQHAMVMLLHCRA